MGEAPGRKRAMAFVHAGQHLFARFAYRFGRIAGSCNGFFIFSIGTHEYHLLSITYVDYFTLLYDNRFEKGRIYSFKMIFYHDGFSQILMMH